MRNITLAALIIGMAGAAATAEVFDDDSRAGLVRDVLAPVVVYNNTGATPASSVRVWSPWMVHGQQFALQQHPGIRRRWRHPRGGDHVSAPPATRTWSPTSRRTTSSMTTVRTPATTS